MKHDSQRELLDDLYSAPGAGPNCDIVLGMVREHHTAARRRRSTVMLGLLIALGGAAFFLRDTTPKAPHALAAAHSPPMRHINDEELLDVFDGQPAAIATLPDGTQRLLLVVKATR